MGIVLAVWGDWGGSWFYDGSRQGIELFQYIINCGLWDLAYHFGVSSSPVEAFYVVGENHTGYGEALGYVHLEWVAFGLVGDWAYDCQTYLCIVFAGG